jgi:4-hydroxy-tetrahydrodipicolinate synthase
MSRLVELVEQGDFAAARSQHQRLLPLLMVNFIESNPIPVKSAMASMGLLHEVYRLPMVPPRPASKQRIDAVLQALASPRAFTRDAVRTAGPHRTAGVGRR